MPISDCRLTNEAGWRRPLFLRVCDFPQEFVGDEGTMKAAPTRKDSHRVPGVEKNDAEAGKVLDVARHKGKVVFKGRGSDHTIRHVERGTS